jgi:CheY-like chemotaxis protein
LITLERNWNKKSILIVDDDPTSIILFEEYLANTSALLFSASNSVETMEILKNSPVDLILMDLQLEDISGFMLLTKIRNFDPNIPVIAETAFASAEDRRKCISSGFNGFLSKPIFMEDLFEELDRYLNF